MKPKLNKLEDIPKTNPFRVPDDYFVQFNKEMMNKLPKKEPVKAQTVSIWDKAKPWVYLAAMFAGIYFILQIATNIQKPDRQQTAANSTSQSDNEILFDEKYWSEISITEEEFYQYLEDILTEDGYYNYLLEELYYPAGNNL